MEKVASKGTKIDLHIHSVYSKEKDKEKVAYNTLEHLPTLVEGLIDNDVELCAITDHDEFNYEIYRKLKEEEKKDNCIKKVLPGIEFSVEFLEGKIIHIVTIFDDKDDVKVKNIEQIMSKGKGVTGYRKTKGAYPRADYFDILNEINIDFIMIAHQKKTVTSQHKPHANDVMSLGKDTFNQLVFMDYFDAYEFRNKKNEIYNKTFLVDNDLEENLRFVTGSDCHNWLYYPNTQKEEKTQFSFTYIKSLPTFKGLAMAVTDYHRISLMDKFFNPVEKFLPEIVLNIDGENICIPMSKGINVIIGDNSIGKSLFLNALTKNIKVTDRKLKRGYEKYLERNKTIIETGISEEDIFMYNQQGEIREIFDTEGMKPNEYLKQFYPDPINADKYRNVVEKDLQKLYGALENKFAYDENIAKLPNFTIAANEILDISLTFVGEVKKNKTDELQKLIGHFETVIDNLQEILCNKVLREKDRVHIKNAIETFEIMLEGYKNKLEDVKKENEKINVYNTYMRYYKQNYGKKITDEQAVYSEFIEAKNETIQSFCKLLEKREEIREYKPNIEEIIVEPECNPVDKYRFISKTQIEKISNEYIEELLRMILKKGKKISTQSITERELKDYIKNYPAEDEALCPLDVLKSKIQARLEKDFKIGNTIVDETMDVFEEVSSGFDAQMYFTLISGETRNKGIYLIDQPEDHISQKAIKDKVLDQFRRMGQLRQVIMVTHNPQFIVNLDVDNVIFLAKENGSLAIKSGALEYENEDYSILKIVADNIDGGLQTILGRMKRYEKNIGLEE